MKKQFILALALSACLALPACAEDTSAETEISTEQVGENGSDSSSVFTEGLERSSGGGQVCFLDEMQSQFGMHEEGGVYVYAPTDPKPLNVFIFAHPSSEIGINMDGIHTLDEVDRYTINDMVLSDWSYSLSSASNNALQFVFDPNDADILLIVKRSYPFYATYSSSSGQTAAGHSCTETLTAVQLTNLSNQISISDTNIPADTVTTSGGSKFWEPVPKMEDQIHSFVNTIIGWYGYGAAIGSSGEGVRKAQQSMIDRGFLEGSADGAFGPMTEAAVKLVQEHYGIDQTGIIDRDTMMAIYYNQEAVDYLREHYPETEEEQG